MNEGYEDQESHLVDEKLQLDDGGPALVLAIALHARTAKPAALVHSGE